jgi:hypothetical protein
MVRFTDLPPVTMAHRLAAFELLAWPGTTYELAMQDDTRSRVLCIVAARLRTAEWKRSTPQTVALVKRCELGLDGHPIGYRTQRVASYQYAAQTPLF